jgi:acyl CoA:acetate/3-ketoacid CoA transferase alpha subunit
MVEVELVSQGTLAGYIRAGGVGMSLRLRTALRMTGNVSIE